MTAKQLTDSILQLAIQGKLVPQNPDDEPASVLLDRIREEKKWLVKEGLIKLSKPEKSVKDSKDEYIEIPSNWTWCLLNDVCRVFGRIGFRGYTKEDLRYRKEDGAISISPSNMVDGKMDYSHCTYISNEKYEESPEIMINEGDLLIVKTGSSYGKVSLIKQLPWKATINPQIAVLKDIKVNPEFLLCFLQSSFAQSMFKGFVLGTSIPTFSQLNLLSVRIPLPPLQEQARIVDRINELILLINEYGSANDELVQMNSELPEKLKKSILKEAIMGKLGTQDPNDEPASVLLDRIREEKKQLVKAGVLKKKDLVETPVDKNEIPFDLPDRWEWVRIKTIANKIVDGDHNPPKGLAGDSGYYMLSSKNINNDGLVELDSVRFLSFNDWEKCNERTNLKKGDVLLTTVGTLGRSCVYEGDTPYCFQRSVSIIQSFIFNYYLKYCFDSPFFQSLIDDKATGTAQRGFYLNQLENAIIPLPPLAEQHRIVEKIEALFAEVDHMEI